MADFTITTDESTPVNIDLSAELGPVTVLDIDTSSLQGNLAIQPNGVFSYDPDGEFDSLDTGEDAIDSFRFTIPVEAIGIRFAETAMSNSFRYFDLGGPTFPRVETDGLVWAYAANASDTPQTFSVRYNNGTTQDVLVEPGVTAFPVLTGPHSNTAFFFVPSDEQIPTGSGNNVFTRQNALNIANDPFDGDIPTFVADELEIEVAITVDGVTPGPVPAVDLDEDLLPWADPVLIGNLQADDDLGTSFDDGDGQQFEVDAAGNAQLAGTAGADSLTGGAFNDRLSGAGGDDTIDGGAGVDRVAGNAGNDVVNGGDGDDFVYGNAGDDQLNGGSGNDRLDGGAGDDLLTGGTGADLFVYDGRGNDVITDFAVGVDDLELPAGAAFTVSEDLDGNAVLTFDAPLGTLTLVGLSAADVDLI